MIRTLPTLRLLAALFACVANTSSHANGLIINEFVAVNDTGLLDEDSDASDWIEIFNSSSNQIDLTDLYLTDNDTSLTQWRFPAVQLNANSYLVIFASNKDRRVVGQELHTNFKLSGGGEYLGLIDGDGFTVLHDYAPSYPEQLDDASYGISTNENSERRYFSTPTPGSKNQGDYQGIVEDTTFSVDRGFFQAPFEVAIASATPGATIRYTRDFNPPSEVSGTIYTGPILVDKTTIIRAIAYKTGYRSTDVDTQSYIFHKDVVTQPSNPAGFPATWGGGTSYYAVDPNVINNPLYNPITNALRALPTVSLVTANANLFDSSFGIYVNGGAQGVAWERPTSAEWIDADGKDRFQIDCGLRIQGGAGRSYRKHSVRLLFKNLYGPSKLNANIFPGPRAASSFDTFILRAGWNDAYSGGTHQYFLDECARRTQLALGVEASHGQHVHLYINGLYWGLYNAAEKPDQAFGETYFGGDKDSYDVIAIGEAIEGTTAPWNALINLARSGPMTDALYEQIQGNHPDGTRNFAYPDYLDVDNYIDNIMTRQWEGDWDWPHNNWHAIRNRDDAIDGGFKFIVWDAEAWNLGSGNRVSPNTMNSGAGIPYYNLFPNAEFKLRYADHIYRHYFNDGPLTTNAMYARYQGLAAEIEPAIMAENARWGGAGFTLAQWQNEGNNFLNQILLRSDRVMQQYKDNGLYPGIEPPVLNQRGGVFTNGFLLTMTSTNAIHYTLDNTDPRERGTGNTLGTPYSAPLTLTHSVIIKARARSTAGEWSALEEVLFVMHGAEPPRVTEMMYNPRNPTGVETNGSVDNDDFEFFELHNPTTNIIGMAGMHFTDGLTFDFSDGSILTLNTSEYVIIVNDLAAFTARYPLAGTMPIAGEFEGSLSDGGEQITLKDGLGNVVFRFTYSDNRGWSLAADGAGHSLIPRLLDHQNDDSLDYGANWRPSATIDGSPDAHDPLPPTSVVINEIVAHTDYTNAVRPEYDSNDAIELFNAGTGTVVFANWYLSDQSSDLKKWPIPYGDTLTTGTWLTYDEVSGFHNPITNGFGLNKAGEQVYLSYLPGTSDDRVVDVARFKGQENGSALGRYPDGAAWWYALPPSTNAANPTPFIDVIISEIMYHPRSTPDNTGDNTDDEYIEIENVGSGPAPLWTVAGPWRIDGDVDFTFPENVTLATGATIVVVSFAPTNISDRTHFLNAYGLTNTEVQLMGPFDGKLSNSGDGIALERPQEPDTVADKISWVIMDEAIFFDQTPWPPEADGTGQPLQRSVTQRSGNNPANWTAAFWSSPGHSEPAFRIDVPRFAETVLLGSTLPVSATFDSNLFTGTVTGVEFFLDGNSLGVDVSPPYTNVLPPLTEERVYTIAATLTDSTGTYSARPVDVSVSTVRNLAATDIGVTGANLRGETSNDGAADVTIFWGPTDGGTNASSWANVVDRGRRRNAFATTIAGLLANGTYYYRCMATNAYGTLWATSTTNVVTRSPDVTLTLTGSPFFENGGVATVHAHINRLSSLDVTIGMHFAGEATFGSDYTVSSTSIVVTAGETTASATLTGLDDPEVETVESLEIRLGHLILGATGTFDLVSATLISDDPRIANTPAKNVTDSTAQVGGTLTHGYGSDVFVYWGTTDGGTNTSNWEAANTVGSSQEGPFTTTLVGLTANQTYYFRSYAFNLGGHDWADSSLSLHTGPPTLSIDDITVSEGNAGTADATFPVNLSARSATDVSMDFTTADGTAFAGEDYILTQGNLFIPAGQDGGQIVVDVIGDADDEWPSENFLVNLSNPTNSTLADSQGIGVIQDDDVAVTLAPWLYRIKISFPGYDQGETLKDFPALITFDTNLTNFAYTQFRSSNGAPNWSSLRFATSNVTALLNYDVERWNTNGRSVVWVQLPELSASNSYIWAYWGNPAVSNAPSFGTNGAAWSAGYKGVWHMAASDDKDATPLAHHGTAVGSVTHITDGRIAGANAFDADIDYIAVPDSDDFTLAADYTLSAWLKSAAIGNQDEGFMGTYSGQGFMFALQNNADNTLRAWTDGWRSSDYATPEDRWVHVAYTRKGSVGRYYVDGQMVRDRNDARAGTNGGELQLGGAGTSWSGNRFDGMLDEVRIATEARSSNWVWACWFNQNSNAFFSSYGEVEAADTDMPSLFVVFGATNITDASACLTARLTSTGTAATVVSVYWGSENGGQDPNQWANTNAFGPVSALPFVDYSFCVTGLQSNNRYYYAYRASNANGTNWAAAHFNAVGGPQIDNNGGATELGVGSVILRGQLLNPSPGEVSFFWGPDDAGTDRQAWASSTSINTVDGNAPGQKAVDGLLYGVRYFYRSYVTNAYGEDWSDTASSFLTTAPDNNPLIIRNGLVLWLDSSDVDGDNVEDTHLSDGASLSSWNDRSGFAHHADNLDGGTPHYVASGPGGKPTLGFNGSDYLYTTYDFDALAGYSILSMARYTGGDSERVIGSRTRNWCFGYFGNNDERWHAEGWIYAGGSANTNWHIHAGRITSDADPIAGFWKDGVSLTTDSQGSHNTVYKPGRLGLGGGTGANNEASRSEIAEVLIYDRVLSGAELDAAGSYLTKKYALDTFYSGQTGAETFGVSTADADTITTHSARMRGTLVAPGAVFDVWLHWGDNDAGPGGTWDNNISFGTYTNVPSFALTQIITNLSSDTTYYYTFSASNTAGIHWADPTATLLTKLDPNGFTYKMKIDFANYAGSTPLTNFPALVRFNTNNAFYNGFASSRGYDLRFTTTDNRRLNHEFDGAWNRFGESLTWVQIPHLTSSTTIWAYWGNPADNTQPAFTTNGATWHDGYNGVWHMNQTTVRDVTEGEHHASFSEDVTATPGVIGTANSFNRDNGSLIRIPAHSDWEQTGDFTISAWIYDSGRQSGEHGFMGTYNSPGFMWAINGDTMGFWNEDWYGGPFILDGTWHHVVVSKHRSEGTYYIDGVAREPFNAGSGIVSYQDLEFGTGGPNWHNWWDGHLDEIRFENVSYPADWHQASYSNQVQGSTFITLGPDLLLVQGIGNQPASDVQAAQASLNALIYSKGTSYYPTVYWGPTDGGTNAAAWAHSYALGTLYDDIGMTNVNVLATTGISEFTPTYFTWRVTNGTHSAWAQPSERLSAEREWNGSVDTTWATPGNWVGDNAPDASAESALFTGIGSGEVDLNGQSYTNSKITFTGGDFTLSDTNNAPGTLTATELRNSGGDNTIRVGLTIDGTTTVSGGSLNLTHVDAYSADRISLSGGTFHVQAQQTAIAGTVTHDFESGDLTGWTVVPYSGSGTGSAFSDGHQPQNVNNVLQGSWSINTYAQVNPNGNADAYTGIIESKSYQVVQPGLVNFLMSSSPHAFSGDPDTPNNNMACFNLEREVAPGDWEMVETANNGNNWNVVPKVWDTTPYVGDTVRFRIYDTSTAGWGHVSVDTIIATGFLTIGLGPVDMTATRIDVRDDATLAASSDSTADFGLITLTNAAVLTITGSAHPLTLNNTTIAPGETRVGLNTKVDTNLSGTGLNASGAPVTFAKTGTGDLIFNSPAHNMENATLSADVGNLVGVHTDGFGAAELSLNGGDLLLSSPGGDIIYPNAISPKTNATLTAGQAGNGVAGPLTVLLNGDIDFPAPHSLTLRTTGGYVLRLSGQINGPGVLSLTEGSIIIDDTDVHAITLNGGSLAAYSNLTVNAFVHNSGTFTLPGTARDLTVNDTFVLSGPLDFSGGSTLLLDSADVLLNNGTTLSYDKTFKAESVEVANGATLTLGNNLLDVDTLIWRNGGNLNMSGPINFTTSMRVWPQRIIANTLTGSGDLFVGDPSDSWGYVTLTGTNTYMGMTQIRRAVVRADETIGMPTNSLLVFNAQGYDQVCVLETSGTFHRDIGQSAGNVYWADTGVGGGWSARGGDLIVTLEGDAALNWSDAGAGFNNRETLIFNSEYADSLVELTNPIDLGNETDRRIHIQNNTSIESDRVRLSGTLSGTGAWNATQLRLGDARERNFKNTLIEFAGTNTYSRRTVLRGGALYAIDGVGLPTNSTLLFQSGDSVNDEAVLLTSGTFTRDIGSENEAPGRVSWKWGSGGFAALGSDVTVGFPNAYDPLDWGSATRGFNNQTLQLNSRYANARVIITNNLDIGGGGRTVVVFDNTDSTTDIAELSGTLFGINANDWLYKNGPGTLCLSGLNTMQQGLMLDDGVIRADVGVGLRSNSRIRFRSTGKTYPTGVIESKGFFNRTLGDGINQVRWEPWDRDGGFAAFGGKLTVDIGAGSEIEIGSVDFLWRPRLVLGSWSANDEVDFVTDLNLRNEWNYVKAYDNTNSPTDRTVMSGDLRNGLLRVYGNGDLHMTGANALRQLVVQDSASIMVDGAHTGSEWIVTENNHPAGLGGSGTLSVPNLEIRNLGRLRPGSSAGTLTTTVSSANGLYMQSGASYEWELGPGQSDTVWQNGNLRLDSGWTLKLLSAGGTPRASDEYNLFTYTGTFTGTETPTSIDTNAIPADWVTSQVQVLHDTDGKRIYLKGLYSVLSVANDPPTDLTANTATLNGFVSALSDSLHVSVFWSTNNGGTVAEHWMSGGFAATIGTFTNVLAHDISHAITGLTTNQRWHYTFRATNDTGTIDLWAAPSMTFNALGPPLVSNTGVSKFDLGSAALSGTFDDHNRGAIIACWGTIDGGTTTPSAWQNSTNIGYQTEADFSAWASSVLYGGTYAYRLFATNAYGTAWSSPPTAFDQNFKPGMLPGAANLQAWYDASTLSLNNGEPVTAWSDSSTNMRHLVTYQGTPNLKANVINGLPVVNFRSENLQMATNSPYFAHDVYFVLRSDSGNTKFGGSDWGAPIGVKDSNDSDRMWMMQNNEDRFWGSEPPSAVSRNGITVSSADDFDMGGIDASQFMVLKVTSGPNSGTHARDMIVGSRTDAWNGSYFDTAEVVAYNSTLSDDDENKLGAYLSQKYNIATAYTGSGNIGTEATLVTLQATNVTITSGWMNANLRCFGATYDIRVYWGPENQTTNVALWPNHTLLGTFNDGDYSPTYEATGLLANTTNWYTFLASNRLDQVWADPSANFITVTSPTVHNSTGATITAGQAVLNGELLTGNVADIKIYWGRTDGGTSTNYEYVVDLPNTLQGTFATTVNAGFGFSNYYYVCYAANAAGTDWAPASTNFSMPRPIDGFEFTDGLRGSMFAGTAANESPINLDGASYTNALTRVFVGDKAGTVLTLAEDPAKNIILYGPVNTWTEFGGHIGDNFVTALSGRFFPESTGSYNFRWSQDDRGLMFIDMDDDGVFDNSDRVGPYDWNGNGNKSLTAAQGYNFIFFAQEFAGGENLAFWYTPPGGSELVVNPTTQSPQWRYATGDAPAASVINTPVSNVQSNTVTLNATLSGAEWTFDVYVYYGRTNGLNVAGDWEMSRFAGTFHSHAGLISVPVSSLLPQTGYHYAFYGENTATNVWAQPSAYFETMGQVTANNGSASAITQTNATLAASLDNGGFGELRIYWGLSDGQTEANNWQYTNTFGGVLLGTNMVSVPALAGAPYYYRAYALNSAGDDWADQTATFTTPRPAVTLSVAPINPTIAESTGQAIVTAMLSAPSVSNVTVNLSFSGDAIKDTDYSATAVTTQIPAGSVSASITLTATDDTLQEEDESISVSIASLVHATNGTPDSADTMITSDDPDVTNGSGASAITSTSATINAALIKGDHAMATIYWGDNNGGTVPAQWDATNTFGHVNEDVLFNTTLNGLVANKTYFYRSYATNTSLLGEDWADTSTNFTTLSPRMSIGNASVTEGNFIDPIATFTVTLSARSAIDVSAQYTTANGTAVAGLDYVAKVGTVVVPANQLSAPFTVIVKADTDAEAPQEHFNVTLFAPVDVTLSGTSAQGTIIDDDASDYLQNWRHWTPISFNSYSGSTVLTNWPALIRLSTAIPSFDYDTFASGTGGDLRFSTDDNTQLLNFEIETWDTNGESIIWVQVPELHPGGTTIHAHWFNQSAIVLPSYATDGSTWDEDFMGVWHMQMTDAQDATPRGHDGSAQGGVSNLYGSIGKANTFDPGDYVSVPKSEDFILQGDYTISAWFYARQGNDHGIMGSWHNGFIFAVRANSLRFHAAQNTGGWDASGGAITLNQWHHGVSTRKDGVAKMYLDGQLQRTFDGRPITGCDEGLHLGSGGQDWRGWWDGHIDESRIENVERSADWIAATHTNQIPGSTFNTFGAIHGIPYRLDRDGDALPDAWELHALGDTNRSSGLSDQDWDGDGLSDRDEFVAGTIPTNDASYFAIDMILSNGEVVVRFMGLDAIGPGYDAMERRYDMLHSTNLPAGPWIPVPGRTNLLGQDVMIMHTNNLTGEVFYRGSVRLK
jgi:hypothetical protein